ncbi:DUF3052 domain-containing protein [Mucilaginibacter sp. RS28]|uniref:DUF3052 domain-containing protein n=1 Tax=Mucilaginibacter straminoryzae TaxID=2932774 RepID=A0A9X2BAM1_9SPHI|nr:DUF3052 domain-containing protein [Mucilaginibacter straminoryzae]MCJ8211546.1 DUF3052 domain-containing protein [Mucilaginibacter straminoryzae]
MDTVKLKTTGYSGTPLAKKLGIKPGFRLKLINPPEYYMDLFQNDLPADLYFDGVSAHDMVHFFTKDKKELFDLLPLLRTAITPAGAIWVSWPKKASKVPTDITEDLIRNYAIEQGLIDVKVCAVDEVWSGLKLVIPVKDRNNG